MQKIHIGDVSIPLQDFAVARSAVLGITRSGKTYAAKGIAEQLMDHGVPIVVFDAIGVWRFLKTPGDGPNARGYPIVVAGGETPDLPLTPRSAPEIVRAAMRENVSLVVDLYDAELSKADWRQIVQSCFRTLLYENKSVRHVFLEEAAEYAPQKVMDGHTYAEVEKLARMGGNKGIGITMINQRAQELNKAILELCDNLLLLRQRGSHAIDSLEKWLDRVAQEEAAKIAKSLPGMTQGDVWVWTEAGEIPIRTRTKPIRSFHPDRRTTGAVETNHKPVDAGEFVAKLTGELAKVIEEAKANDPAALKKRIAELERQPRAEHDPAELHRMVNAAVERAIVKRDDEWMLVRDVLTKKIQNLSHEFRKTADALNALWLEAMSKWPASDSKNLVRELGKTVIASRSKPIAQATPNGQLPPGQQEIINVIATLGVRGIPVKKECVARWLSLHPNGGRFNGNLKELRDAGYLDGLELTEAGRRTPIVLNCGADAALEALPDEGKRNVMRTIWASEESLSKQELADRLGIHPNGGRFNENLKWLRDMGIVTDRGPIMPTPGFHA